MIKNQIIYDDLSDWRFSLGKAEGSFIYDKKGKRYIDFTSGWNVANLGLNNAEIAAAVTAQVQKNSAGFIWLGDDTRDRLAKELIKILGRGLSVIARATSGTESNEMAYKVARAYTKRKRIIALTPSYHGQSFTSLALGCPRDFVEALKPHMEGLDQIEFPNMYGSASAPDDLLQNFGLMLEEELKKEDVAAVITEAGIVSGWGNTAVAPDGFLSLVRELTKKYGTLLILDEVGTGFSRCGRLFGLELEDVTPDIITLAKAISNGVAPIGAMVTTKEIAEKSYPLATLVSTFGWLPISCAAALKTLEIHLRDKIWEKAESDGEHVRETLAHELGSLGLIGDVRGKGMLIGLDFSKEDSSKEKVMRIIKKVLEKADEKGLHIISNLENNIQLMPPLTIPRSILDEGLEMLIHCVKNT